MTYGWGMSEEIITLTITLSMQKQNVNGSGKEILGIRKVIICLKSALQK